MGPILYLNLLAYFFVVYRTIFVLAIQATNFTRHLVGLFWLQVHIPIIHD